MKTPRTLAIVCATMLALAQMGLVNAAAQQESMQQVGVDDNYVIGPNDGLQITVIGYPELTMPLTVRPDGKITGPHVENMLAASKTPSKLARDIEVVLDEAGVKDPQVAVIVTQAVSIYSKVTITGQGVRQTVSIAYYKGLRVLDLVEKAPLTEFAAANNANVVRTLDGKETKIPVRLGDIDKGKMKSNIELLPGDVLVVPQSRW